MYKEDLALNNRTKSNYNARPCNYNSLTRVTRKWKI